MAERFYQELFGGPDDEGDIVGASVTRVDAPPKSDGSPVFSSDHRLSNPLYVAPVMAPYPSGILKSVDPSAAERAPGVACVLTARDIPGEKRYGMAIADQPVLVEERMHSLQDIIALVAAESPEQAEYAATLVKIRAKESTPVFDPLEALRPEAPIVQPDFPGDGGPNILSHIKIRKGDPEAGFAQADVIVENIYETQMIDHAYLEPDTGYVLPNPDGTITCTGPTQCPHMVRRVIAPVLGLAQSDIRFVSTPPGGGFGGKEETSIEIAMRAGLVALKTGRPVIYTYTREESLGAKAKRVPAIIEHKIGARRNGKITAIKIKIYLNKGPYAAVGAGILKKLVVHCTGPYECANVWVDGIMVRTNNINTCAMRGLGVPQVHFAAESQMDELGRRLKMDPFGLRRINGFRVGSKTATRQVLDQSVGLVECLDSAESALRPHPSQTINESGLLQGRGVAAFWYSTGAAAPADSCGAQVHLTDDGKLQVGVGIIELGQGSHTVLAQIAAEAMGVNFEDVRIMPVDTDAVPESGFTAGSRSTTIPGNAICEAIAEVRESLSPIAAEMLEASKEDIGFKGGRVFVKSAPEKSVQLKEVVKRSLMVGQQVSGQGWFTTGPLTFNPETGEGRPFMVYSYGVQVADVEVDPETGEVWVKRIVAAHDVGRAINPDGVTGQLEGGIEMGIGQALIEEVEVHEGKVLTPDYARYEIPVSMDTPEIVSLIVEDRNATGPYGAKGVGESAMVPTLAAISNAVRDAIGVRIRRLPITSEDVVFAIRRKKVL